MAISGLLIKVFYATSLANVALANQQQQPWLDPSLPYEERLHSFVAQLNTTQKLAMTQGDTEVCRAHRMI
jgi:beta-glucosidase